MQQNQDRSQKHRPPSAKDARSWLENAIVLGSASFPRIRHDVREMMQVYEQKNNNKPRHYLSYKVSGTLIKRSAIRAGILGGITSSPAILPGIGTVGTLLIGLTADLVYLLKIQTELCYAIAMAYETSMDEEELQTVILALIGFTGTTEAAKGVASSVLRHSIDSAVHRYLQIGFSRAAATLGRKLGLKIGKGAARVLPFVGIPIGSSMNIASTMLVGNQARRYFNSWHYAPGCWNGQNLLPPAVPVPVV